MRIFGGLLIASGLLLCLTIFLAPLGIILIIAGIVCVVIGGRQKTVITNVVQVAGTPGDAYMQANVPVDEGRRSGTRSVDGPLPPPDPRLTNDRARPVIDVTPSRPEAPRYGYDRAKWDALVAFDEDIARIEQALAPYGQSYVDQFAAAYLALNDKRYLPAIIEKILASAKQDARARSAAR
jgi:hypothetical protein